MSVKRKPVKSSVPSDPVLAAAWRKVMSRHRHYATIREFAAELVRLVHYKDDEGREIGFDYEYIRDAILRRFPTVKIGGPHKGRPTRMSYKELQKITGIFNRDGVKLPFRPRRKAKKKPNR